MGEEKKDFPAGVNTDADQVITTIGDYIRRMELAQMDEPSNPKIGQADPETLSKLLDSLGSVNWALGLWLAHYEKLESDSKIALDFDLDEEIENVIKEKSTPDKAYPLNKAEIRARLNLRDKIHEHNDLKSMANKLGKCRKALETKVDTARSRLARIGNDLRQA